jgi:hypothetical protein
MPIRTAWPCLAPPPGQLSTDSGVRTKFARRSPHVRLLLLAPSLRPTVGVRALPLRRAELSHLPHANVLPSLLSCPSSGRAGTKGPLLPCILSAPLSPLSVGKDAAASALVSATSTPSPDLTSLPLASSTGPGAPTHFRKAPQGVAHFPDHQSRPAPPSCTGELRPSVARLSRFELDLSTMSGALGAHSEDLDVARAIAVRCRAHHGGARCTHCWLMSEPRALPRAERPLRPGWPR